MYVTSVLGLGATPASHVQSLQLLQPEEPEPAHEVDARVAPSRYSVYVDGVAAVAVAATWAHWPAGGKKNLASSLGVTRYLYVPSFLIHHRARRVVPTLRRVMSFELPSERYRMRPLSWNESCRTNAANVIPSTAANAKSPTKSRNRPSSPFGLLSSAPPPTSGPRKAAPPSSPRFAALP